MVSPPSLPGVLEASRREGRAGQMSDLSSEGRANRMWVVRFSKRNQR